MSNLLKITAPAIGYENNNQVKQGPAKAPETNIQGPITPDKVVKPDARSDAASQDQSTALKFRYESNYENFIQRINALPIMTEQFASIFIEQFATLAESGIQDGFAQSVARFLQMIGVEPQDMMAFIKNQGNATVRFSGPFFTLLQQAFEQTNSVELKSNILDFLKKYVDMAESSHIMKNMDSLLGEIQKRMFPNSAKDLNVLLQNLGREIGPMGEGMNQNLQVLKQEILPFLNDYISKLNERGDLRELVSLLSSYMARAENGNASRVMEAFEQLLRFQGMQKVFQNFDPNILFQVLQGTEYEKSVKKQNWMQGLVDLIEHGMSGELGAENKAAFQNLMQAILLNESVYLPVLHLMLPLHVNGRLMFSEMWIDPNVGGSGEEGEQERAVQGLIKFDIQELGFFDMFFIYEKKKSNIKLQLSCPEVMKNDIDNIKNGIAMILAQNNIQSEELHVSTESRSIPISSAFPKVFERKNSINVSI